MIRDIYLKKSIPEIVDFLKKKKIKIKDLFDESYRKYGKYEKHVKAWVIFNKKVQLNSIKKIQKKYNLKKNALLEGIPFGAKDIFNTIEYKTQMGSDLWKNFTPGNNARVIDKLIGNGCVVIGKTVTAEFAVHELNQTKNPFDFKRTPGTSSSGSAAAVATGMVPFALGTQTAASIIRPASFCGIWGMKPSFGLIPRTGILKTTDSLDTVGFLTSNLYNLKIVLDNLRVKGKNYPFVYNNICKKRKKKNNFKHLKIGFIKTDVCKNADKEIENSINELKKKLIQKKISFKNIIWPKNLNNLHRIHEIIYNKSLSYYFSNEYKDKTKISKIMKAMIENGKSIDNQDFIKAIDIQKKAINKISKILKNFDVVFSLSTLTPAIIRGKKEKNDPSLIWTMSHIPAINIPIGISNNGLPLGIQAIASKWKDYDLINALEILEKKKIISRFSIKLDENITINKPSK